MIKNPDQDGGKFGSGRFEPVKLVAAGQRQRDLILQIGEIEHRDIRHVRPIRRGQIGTLLQDKIRRRDEPENSEASVR